MTSRLAALALVLAAAFAGGAGSANAVRDACPSSNAPNTLALVGGSGQTAQLGKQFQSPLQVALANTNGCPVTGSLAGISVDFVGPGSGAGGVFASTGTRIAVVGTDAQGVATAPAFTANDVAGSYSVDAESDLGTVELFLTNTAGGLPASIAPAGASDQAATVNGTYAQPLQARVLDANGNPVQGAAVSFSVVPGVTGAGASFLGGGGPVTTDSSGVATSPPLLANGATGRFTATASVDGLSSVAVYTLDNHADAMTIAAAFAGDATARVDSRYRQALQATVRDGNGQPVEGASVVFAIASSGAGAGASFLGGAAQATELTDAIGRAISPPILANRTAGTFTATATVAGAVRAATYTLENLAGAPASIAVGAASGESTPAGSRFLVPLAVTVLDADGNAVRGAVVVFAAPSSGPGARFRVHGRSSRTARTTTNAKGIAVAPPLAANARAGGYIVTATVKGTSKRAAFALVNGPRG
jgi:protocatechuate 3,4-dioxygenase beta subunit